MTFETIINDLITWVPAALVIVFGIVIIVIFNRYILHPKNIDITESRWMRQLLLLFVIIIFLILLLLSLPISEGMKGQLFNLLGIAITATIALSSATFVGNTMAGFMLKAIDGLRPGDFLKIDDIVGRVSEQGLLHTEIQTEDRDLTTLPNLYLVTKPVTVVRSSGTIISSTISLGYDVPRAKVETLLLIAGYRADLKECFVQILDLGDFSVTYRIAGFLSEVKYLITVRSKLRGHMLDVLHENGVEIVSPSFMNQRVYAVDKPFIPKRHKSSDANNNQKAPEDVIFDKADEAQSKERIKELIQENVDEIKETELAIKTNPEDKTLEFNLEKYKKRNEYLAKLLQTKEQLED